MNGHTEDTRKLNIRLSCIMLIYFTSVSFGSYTAVYLQSVGYDASHVGIISAVLSLLGFLSTPLFGILSDRASSYEKVIRGLLLISCLLCCAVLLFHEKVIYGINIAVALIVLSNIFRAPVGSLIETYCISLCDNKTILYGSLRSWGSLAFAIMCVLLGFIVPKIGVVSVFPAMGIVLLLNCLLVQNTGKAKAKKYNEPYSLAPLLQNKEYLLCIAFTMIISVSTTCTFTFLPYLFSAIGENTGKVGLVIGYSGLIECPILLLYNRLGKSFSLKTLFGLSGILYAITSVCYAVSSSFLFILLISSTLGGIAHGLYVAAGNNYIFQLTDAKTKAAAMTIFASMCSIAGMIGNIIGGKLVANYSVQSYFLMVGVASAIASILFFLIRSRKRTEQEVSIL